MDVVTAICDRVVVLSYGEMIAQRQAARRHRRPARGRGLSRRARRPSTPARVSPWRRPASCRIRRDLGLRDRHDAGRGSSRRNAASIRHARRAPREGARHLAGDDLGAALDDVLGLAAGLETLGFGPAGRDDGHRRQPAAPLLRACSRPARSAASPCRCSPTCRRTRSATSRQEARRALRAGRGPGAGRQAARPARARRRPSNTSSTTMRAAWRPIRSRAWSRGTTLVAPRCGAPRRRARPAPGTDRPRAARRHRGAGALLGHDRHAQGDGADAPQRCSPACGNAYKAGGASASTRSILAYLPMAWVGDFVLTVGGRHRAALHDQHPGAAGDGAARPARGRADLLSRRAARLGQHADARPGRHGGFDAAQAAAVRLLHARRWPRSERKRRRRHADRLASGCCAPLGEWLVFGPIKDYLGMSRMRNAPSPAARRWARTPSSSSARSASS